ncbi:MAG: ISLre2 family transposase [Eubacteriales bacterium]
MNIVTLLEELVNGLITAEDEFFQNPKDFYSLEKSVKSTTEAFSASFLGNVLTSMNEKIYEDGWRKNKYTVQRTDKRTLISSVGDITFESTYFRSRADGTHHYLVEEILGLDKQERFTEEAEVILLTEAMKTSYSEATKVLPSKQEISKTTVMNKIHGIANEMPVLEKEHKKNCKYLFIEADEDHVAEQHGRWNSTESNSSFISKLAYVYEYKQENPKCKARKELVNTFYFGGVYSGAVGTEKFWKNVSDYICKTYNEDELKRIFISGDGAPWIKSGTKHLDKALFCADKFHLMKYINAASRQMLDESELAKSDIYKKLYKRDKQGIQEYTEQMMKSAANPKPIQNLQTFVLGNWSAVMRTYHNKVITGCSAEGHVSHILSDRLSSRPMGWSKTGADRMSKLRCYEKNYGREKIIDLVQYSRQQRKLAKTGTDNVEPVQVSLREIRTEHYNQARSYIDRIQATIPDGTVRKIASIRSQIRLI